MGRENQDEVYIGQSGDVGHRLGQHLKNEKKDWERALVLISLTNNLTQTHALYLESLSIEKAKQCARYELINGNGGQKPHTPIPLKADCDEIHRVGSLLRISVCPDSYSGIIRTSVPVSSGQVNYRLA